VRRTQSRFGDRSFNVVGTTKLWNGLPAQLRQPGVEDSLNDCSIHLCFAAGSLCNSRSNKTDQRVRDDMSLLRHDKRVVKSWEAVPGEMSLEVTAEDGQ